VLEKTSKTKTATTGGKSTGKRKVAEKVPARNSKNAAKQSHGSSRATPNSKGKGKGKKK